MQNIKAALFCVCIKIRNGRNNLKKHIDVLMGNSNKNIGKVCIENIFFNAALTDAENKAVTKSSVDMCALDMHTFTAVIELGVIGLLWVCITISQRTNVLCM